MKKRLKWKPVFSFLCILSSIFFLLALFSPTIGAVAVGFVITVLTAFAQLFDDHFKSVKNFWFNKIYPETHTFFIFLFIIITILIIFNFLKHYRLSLKVEERTITP